MIATKLPNENPADRDLAEALRKRATKLSYLAFLMCVERVLRHLGYVGLTNPSRRSFKGPNAVAGVDLYAYEETGASRIPVLVQLKRYPITRHVSRLAIDAVRGVMLRHGFSRSLVVSTTTFSLEAQEAALAYPGRAVHTINGNELGRLMLLSRIGVSESRDIATGEVRLALEESLFDLLERLAARMKGVK